MTRRRSMMIALVCLALPRLGPGRGTADVAAAAGATRPRAARWRQRIPATRAARMARSGTARRPGRRAQLEGGRAFQGRRLHLRPGRIRLGIWRRPVGRLGRRMDDRLARQRPEFLVPAPAAHVPQGQPRADLVTADGSQAFRSSLPVHDRAGQAHILGRGGQVPPPLPAQRRLPDGRRLLGRRSVGELLPADQTGLPRPRAQGAGARAQDLPVRLQAQGEAPGPEHPHLAMERERPGRITGPAPTRSTTGGSSTTRSG